LPSVDFDIEPEETNLAKEQNLGKHQGMGGREVRTGLDHGHIYDHYFVEFIFSVPKPGVTQIV
jgi:hypothetical protein